MKDEQLVERVAEAICDSLYKDNPRWPSLPEDVREHWRVYARAAIEASGITALREALECLLSRFVEAETEQGRNPEKQSEVIIARAALTTDEGEEG